MSVRIGMGVAGFPYSTAQAFFEWVDLCENSILDSLWVSERLVSPTPVMEPMTTLAMIAGRTRRLKFGMNAIVLPFRDPLILAKECATLDFLSDGRLLPAWGVGGEIAPEFRATKQSPFGRGAKSDEMLDVMVRLWEEDRVTHEGKFYQYEDVTITPKPKQKPLPLWIGGSSDAAIRRTARVGTGWLAGTQSPAQCAEVVTKIRAASAEAGRPLDPDHYGAGFAYRFGNWDEPVVQKAATGFARIPGGDDPRSVIAVGGPAEIIARAREYADAGISKFVLRPLTESDAEMMAQTQRLIDEVAPEVHTW